MRSAPRSASGHHQQPVSHSGAIGTLRVWLRPVLGLQVFDFDLGDSMHWVQEAAQDLSEVTQGIPNHGKLGKQLKPIVDARGWGEVRPNWRRFLRSVEVRFISARWFVESYGAWTHDEDPTVIRSGESLDAYQARLAAL